MRTQRKCENVDQVLGMEKVSFVTNFCDVSKLFYVASETCTVLHDTNM